MEEARQRAWEQLRSAIEYFARNRSVDSPLTLADHAILQSLRESYLQFVAQALCSDITTNDSYGPPPTHRRPCW